MTDQEMMQSIRAKHGAAIARACDGSDIPPEFLAALVANESGGDPNAKRFEPGVLAALWSVLVGREAAYGSIGRANLLAYLSAAAPGIASLAFGGGNAAIATAVQRLDGLACSWGLTQIMGYESAFELTAGDPSGLQNADKSFLLTRMRLLEFAKQFDLRPAVDFSELLHCWNTGQPNRPTADLEYVPKALARMAIYRQLPPLQESA